MLSKNVECSCTVQHNTMIDAEVSQGGSNGLDIIANIALINHQVRSTTSLVYSEVNNMGLYLLRVWFMYSYNAHI